MKKILVSFVMFFGFGTAFAKTFDCKQQGIADRKVEIKYLSEGKQVPCEVVYTSNGAEKNVGNAKNEVGYCEKSAEDFLAKLKSMGWSCGEASAPAQEAVPAKAASDAMKEVAPAVEAPAPTPAN